MQSTKIILNGVLMDAQKPIITANNRSFRYGDGCFETIKAINGKIIHAPQHFQRLFQAIKQLQFDAPNFFSESYFTEHIQKLLHQNNHLQTARIRLTIFRGDGGLYDAQNNFPNYCLQTWQLNSANNQFNQNGLVIDVYKDAIKVCDAFSQIKSNNYLPYVMAALWAKKNHLNDALLLNPYDKIADATIANIFIVQDGIIKTPAITEGCVNGIMKNYLLQCMHKENMPVEETSLTIDDVLKAQEVFLTNSIYGIKWVKQCGNSNYVLQTAAQLHKKIIGPLWA